MFERVRRCNLAGGWRNEAAKTGNPTRLSELIGGGVGVFFSIISRATSTVGVEKFEFAIVDFDHRSGHGEISVLADN